VRNARAAASCRYRIGHFLELTSGADVVLADKLPSCVAKRAQTIVCIRPCLTPAFARTLEELRRAGKRLLADFDDLLFAGDVSGLPASARGRGNEREAQERLARYAAALDAFDGFIVSTRALASRLVERRARARVSVVPNGLSRSWVEQGRALYPRSAAEDRLVMRYFSGSPSHDHDFASVLRPLQEFLARHPHVMLEIFGPLRLATPGLPPERVRRLHKIGYDHLPGPLATSWVNLAPLADTEFNSCKSALKFLESAAFGCPTLASRSDDLLRHQELGADVVLCNTEQDWYRELDVMLEPGRRRDRGLSAMRHVAEHGLADVHVAAWLRAITSSQVS
jgi:Glycosyl transferases group 1